MTQVRIEQALQIAVGHHQAGRLAEAETVYRQILAHNPDQPHTLHLLGVIAYQVGNTRAAIELIGRAILNAPDNAEFHSNLGESYRLAGQSAAAIASLHRAIELRPDLAEAHNHLGLAERDSGRPDLAADSFRRAIALRPDLAEAHNNLGVVCSAEGLRDEAIAAYERALVLLPEDAGAHNNLGNVLWDLGRRDEAVAAYGRAIQHNPGLAEAHNNLGSSLKSMGRLDEAIRALNRTIELKPEHAEAHKSLGNALRYQGRLDLAIEHLSRAVELAPNDAAAQSDLGNALCNQGRFDEAIVTYHRALQLEPDMLAAHNNLGSALKDQGRLDEALAYFRKAVALEPGFVEAASNFLFTLHYHPAYDAPAILTEHRHWATRYADPLAAEVPVHDNDRSPVRKLRVGYVSPDFSSHPVGQILLALFTHHDRRQIEIYCYSDAPLADEVTAKLKALADGWHDNAGLRDPQVAERIRTDRIDILVDLALHSAGNRMLVFARKPAPVQVTMLGMPATTGLATIDYRLTDPYLDPPGDSDGHYVEQSIRLPHCYWCYQPPAEAPLVSELPARANGFLTFGCLNQFSKVSSEALELWLRILQALPRARLLVYAQPGSYLHPVRARFRAGGIADDRVEFLAKVTRSGYFERYRGLDLSLDPFPYNGHTSTLDSLWMGVPVITLAGRTAVGRGGVSLLSNAGLPEFIAHSPQQYVELATRWNSDLPGLAALRGSLRERMLSSALMDGRQYTAAVEAVYRRVWERWCGSGS